MKPDDLEPDGPSLLRSRLIWCSLGLFFSAIPGAERKSLSGIDWTIQKGQTVGIVGRTGAGKTTWFDNSCGSTQLVRENLGQPATDRGLQPTLHRRKIDYVSQEHILFTKSIRENTSALVKGASQEDLVELE